MRKTILAATAFLSVVLMPACSASLAGSATALGPGDRCGGHLDCGQSVGCCNGAGIDGAGWSCNLPGSARPCEYVGLSPDGNGTFSAKRGDAGK